MYRNRIHVVHRSSSVNQRVNNYLLKLKSLVHDAAFGNPRSALRMLSKKHIEKMKSEEDIHRKQELADKCVTILAAEVDVHYDSQAFEKEMSQQDMLTLMKSILASTSNSHVSNIILCSRAANLLAFTGNFDSAEQMLAAARTSSKFNCTLHRGCQLTLHRGLR